VLGIVALNMGGPDSPEAVEPFLRNLFSDPDIIDLGWAKPLQGVLARRIARRRAPYARAAYAQIGGRSPILEESQSQVQAVAAALRTQGVPALPFVAMNYWHPFPAETVVELRAAGIERVVLLPLYPHRSRTTVGSSLRTFNEAANGLQIATVNGYAADPGYVTALADRIREALMTVPAAYRDQCPVVFSAHGLPESYIRGGDLYLDDVRATVSAVTQKLSLGRRMRLAFQSRVGRQRWLGPSTEGTLERLASEGYAAMVVVPVSFTNEHIETLQELDIVCADRARRLGLATFARARTVGCHPAFISALATLAANAARQRGWI
jgi:ferrochelatase